MTNEEKRERRKVRHELYKAARKGYRSIRSIGRFSTSVQVKAAAKRAVDQHIAAVVSEMRHE